uniref:Uncharacterized protein n=1 Tax=Amphora coffeiformis TaxID=265554 RepID=A0A7S3KWF6_9STRA|mmetsp:Transcript_4015/g.7716  ORF Transcript_4015/g.7716 Transcript_4015/m.7716 type:complete len:278 (-) Transcript_4015:209-1042(-)
MESAAEEAKLQVNECEKEIAGIKARLKALGPAASSEESEAKNVLTVKLVKTAGLPESANLKLTLQLTSPIEEATLTTAAPEATFHSVELGQAMLSMTATDADVPLGAADSIDLASMIQLDAMRTEQTYVVNQDVGFQPEGSSSAGEPVFHATLQISFVPSPKDQREELYELLNKATTKKNQAVEKLRQTALAASRQQPSSAVTTSKPAVKPGFLNKSGAGGKPKTALDSVLAKWDAYLGPKSFVRQAFPIAKNYVIFFAAMAIFHYKGDMLSLPPPV